MIERSDETVARVEERVATLACVDVLAHTRHTRRLFYVHATACVSNAANEISTTHSHLYAAVLIALPVLFVAAVLAVVPTLVATTPLLLHVYAAANAAAVAHAVAAAQLQLHVAVLLAVVVVVAVAVLIFVAVLGGVTLVPPTRQLLRIHCATAHKQLSVTLSVAVAPAIVVAHAVNAAAMQLHGAVMGVVAVI